jgi:hypothetical protein
MIKAWILNLRRKPKVVRERVAFAAAAGVSAFIFAIWAATIPFRLPDQPTQSANVFGGLVDSVKNEFEDAPQPDTPPIEENPAAPFELEWSPIATTSTEWWSPESATTTAEQPRAIRIATTTASSTVTGQ